MTPGAKRHSLARRVFRGCRVAVLLLILLAAALLLWSNYVAVPAPITNALRAELRKNNVALDFQRLRLNGFRKLVAEGLAISGAGAARDSRLEISHGELKLRYGGSLSEPVAIAGLRLNQGIITVAINEPGETPRYLTITNLHADIEFKRGDQLRIVALSGEALGARANISGLVRNFSNLRLSESSRGRGGSEWRRQLRDVLDLAQQLSFAAPPELTVSFAADGKDLAKTRGLVNLRADAGASRWGAFQRLRVTSAVTPLTNQPSLRAGFSFLLDGLASDQTQLASVKITAESEWSGDMERLLTNHVSIDVTGAKSPWIDSPAFSAELLSFGQKSGIRSELKASAEHLAFAGSELRQNTFSASAQHTLPFTPPARLLSSLFAASPPEASAPRKAQEITGDWRFASQHARLPRAEAQAVIASGEISTRNSFPPPDPALSFWEYLRPFNLPWQLQLSNLTAGEAQIGTLAVKGGWNFPLLSATEITADLYRGRFSGRASLDVQSRMLNCFAETSFDYHDASVLLDPPVQKWLEQFAWENPPFVQTEANLRLPSWTSSWANLEQSLLRTLTLDGRFEGRGSFRGIPLGLAQSRFTFTNFVWSLPDLQITRPEGRARLSYSGNVTNLQFSAQVESQINPAILASAFGPELQQAFHFVRFSTPPIIRARISGDLDQPETLEAQGSLAATNFFAKEQAMSDIRTDFAYRNRKIELTDLVAHRGKEQVTAPLNVIDLAAGTMFVTNAVSTIDPYIAMSLVGDETYEAIDPYRFANTPVVTIDGLVPLGNVRKANLHFGVSGTDFTYWRFHLKELAGDVYWKGLDLSFSNVVAEFYGGRATWSGSFQIEEKTPHAQFSFHGTATDASLHPLARDLFGVTNRLDGIFSGDLTITSAHTSSILSWDGYGQAALKDGYLWSIPIFGLFTPALESIAPGLGSAPVSSGAGTFTITNSVIYTRDLQVKAPGFRLNYKGNVDLEGRLDARVEAELLRDTWVLGKLFSTALWPVSKAFEAQVTGKLTEPKTKFRFVPKFVFAPFKVVGAIAEAAKKKEPKTAPPEPKSAPE